MDQSSWGELEIEFEVSVFGECRVCLCLGALESGSFETHSPGLVGVLRLNLQMETFPFSLSSRFSSFLEKWEEKFVSYTHSSHCPHRNGSSSP